MAANFFDNLSALNQFPLSTPLRDVQSNTIVTLSDILIANNSTTDSTKHSKTLIVLLRHSTWLPWKVHVQELSNFRNQFSELSTQIILISFIEADRCLELVRNIGTSFPIFQDTELTMYDTLGLEKSMYKSFHFWTIWYYFKMMVFGHRIISPYRDEDISQLGGNVILDNEGNILYVHRCQRPDDRPTTESLLALLRAI